MNLVMMVAVGGNNDGDIVVMVIMYVPWQL